MMNLTEMTPREVDEALVEAMKPLQAAQASLADRLRSVNRYAKFGMKTPEYITNEIAKLRERIETLNADCKPYDDEWRRRGRWSRYIKCMSDGGHVHYHGCHTLTPGKTIVAWLPALSGKNEAELVDAIGYTACTYCFPSAPTWPSWIKGEAEAKKIADAKAAATCPGSGKYVSGHGYRYATCPDCKKTVSITPRAALRSHKS